MDVAALVAWVVTAGGGAVLLGTWLVNGGLRQQKTGRSRLKPAIAFSHFGLAATGLVLWLLHVTGGNALLGWLAFGLLLVIASLGFAMYFQWLGGRGAHAGVAEADPPAEQRFPTIVVTLHGVAAVTTLILVLLGAAGVAD